MNRRLVSLIVVVVGLAACSEVLDRERPVGRSGMMFTDADRSSWTDDGDRPLATTIWYPASEGAEETEWTVGVFRAGWTALDAEFATNAGPLPLIVLSHGTGGAAAQLSWLAEKLASNGYVVAAVNHHGNTAAEEAYLPQGFTLWWERARDVSAVIDALLGDPRFGPRIDSLRVGVAGFSLGGYTALAVAGARVDRAAWGRHCDENEAAPSCTLPPEAPFTMSDVEALMSSDPDAKASLSEADRSFRDDRVDAAYAMAPVLGPALAPESLAEIAIPVRIVVGESDDQAIPAITARPIATAIPDAELKLIPGAGHYVFLAECGIRGQLLVRDLCTDAGGIDRGEIHDWVAADAVTFFDRTLREISPPSASRAIQQLHTDEALPRFASSSRRQ